MTTIGLGDIVPGKFRYDIATLFFKKCLRKLHQCAQNLVSGLHTLHNIMHSFPFSDKPAEPEWVRKYMSSPTKEKKLVN